MKKADFRKLFDDKILILDGATGTNLMNAGMPLGVCPEKWILEHPQIMFDLQVAYLNAGTDILYAPTFTCNRIKLNEYGLADDLEDMNRRLVELSKEAVKAAGHGLVAGDITMTGEMLYPMGKLKFEELVDVYKEQIKVIDESGCDLLVVETMMSLAETRAAVIAANEVSDLPIIASLTFNEDGRTLYGTDPVTAVNVLQNLGVAAIGVNCSTGPDKMVELVRQMKSIAFIPVFAKPNAGMPELVNDKSVYRMTPEEFAEDMKMIIEAGAGMVGGCCGTRPEHIKALADMASKMPVPEISSEHVRCISSERSSLIIDLDAPFKVVGERINPTGKKKLQAELREGSLELVMNMAEEQVDKGASILDINVGMNGIDERDMMLKVVYQVSQAVNLPLCLDSSSPEVLEAALRIYPGRALINSISLEEKKCRPLMRIAKKYGAMAILLPLSDKGLPENLDEKKEIIRRLLEIADEEGLSRDSLIIDGLVATVGANRMAALETLDTIAYCKNELQIPTICGLSNISFGLPERINVNTAFLTMAIANGLTMAICNPGQAMLVNASLAADLLLAKEDSDNIYVENVVALSQTEQTAAKNVAGVSEEGSRVYHDVVKGNKGSIVENVKKELESGKDPQTIIDEDLIPAVNKVGELFEQKKYFLPQLIAGATAMDLAIEYITPLLHIEENAKPKGTVIMATVEGDIHDIGKNLVVLMLKNYGYKVVDLGKDVPLDKIIAAAKEEHADIIGLSALMTTTMMRMKDAVEYVRANNLPYKVIIGGAVVSQNFADEIGADGYSKDANEAVKLVDKLLTDK